MILDRTEQDSKDQPISPTVRSLPRIPEPAIQTAVYTYGLLAGSTELQFSISVHPKPGYKGIFVFQLSLRTGSVERALCDSVELRLSVDYTGLQFAVFVVPHKNSIPVGSHWNLRVWLRANRMDHRLFADDDLWVGTDLDFTTIEDASIARLIGITTSTQTYQGVIGGAVVNYIIRWQAAEGGLYTLSLEYETGGVARILFENYKVSFECDPNTVAFIIYTVPMTSNPPGASHRIRLWLRTPVVGTSIGEPLCVSPMSGQSCIYQRVWKSDDLRLGSELDFRGLGSRMVMGVPLQDSPQVYYAGAREALMSVPPPPLSPSLPSLSSVSSLPPSIYTQPSLQNLASRDGSSLMSRLRNLPR